MSKTPFHKQMSKEIRQCSRVDLPLLQSTRNIIPCITSEKVESQPPKEINIDDAIFQTKDIFEDENGNIDFLKISVNHNLIALHSSIKDFVTSVIVKHEIQFYQLIEKEYGKKYQDILGTTAKTIIDLIIVSTTSLYNKIYREIQYQHKTQLSDAILNMCKYTPYDSHILLDKLWRFTLDVHLEIVREELIHDSSLEIYIKSIKQQIDIFLLPCDLLQIFAQGIHDSGPFINIPQGEEAFKITNIELITNTSTKQEQYQNINKN